MTNPEIIGTKNRENWIAMEGTRKEEKRDQSDCVDVGQHYFLHFPIGILLLRYFSLRNI
jgi:hypothetical protein